MKMIIYNYSPKEMEESVMMKMKTKADFVTYLGGVSAQMLLHNFGTFTGSQ
jgi:hypothetical protein